MAEQRLSGTGEAGTPEKPEGIVLGILQDGRGEGAWQRERRRMGLPNDLEKEAKLMAEVGLSV